MAAREAALLALLLGLALPAAAHGPDPDRLYDPLDHPLVAWLGSDGALALDAPAEGFVALSGPPGQEAPPRSWTFPVPLPLQLVGGVGVKLVFRAEGPVLPRLPDNALLRVSAKRGGQELEGSAALLAAPEAPLQPDKPYTLTARAGAGEVALTAGGTVGLRVAFLGTAPNGPAGLVLGPSGSGANLSLTAASLDDLGHDHPGWRHVRVDEFNAGLRVTTLPVWDIDAHHGDFEPSTQLAPVGIELTVRVIDAESPEQGAEHGLWGVDRPHRVRLQGPGLDARFGVYPGEVLLRTLRLDQPGAYTMACEDACNATGVFATLQVEGPRVNASPAREQSVRIGPGKSHEVDVTLRQGERLTWSFEARPPVPIRWDIHSHSGDQVVVHARGENATASGAFTAPHDGVYSLLMENSNPTEVELRYTAEGGSPYAPPPASAPWPAALALIALVAAAAVRRR